MNLKLFTEEGKDLEPSDFSVYIASINQGFKPQKKEDGIYSIFLPRKSVIDDSNSEIRVVVKHNEFDLFDKKYILTATEGKSKPPQKSLIIAPKRNIITREYKLKGQIDSTNIVFSYIQHDDKKKNSTLNGEIVGLKNSPNGRMTIFNVKGQIEFDKLEIVLFKKDKKKFKSNTFSKEDLDNNKNAIKIRGSWKKVK